MACLPSVVHVFEHWLGQTKDFRISICCYSAKHTALRRKINLNRIMYLSGATCLSMDCCFSELVVSKSSKADIIISSKVTCSQNDILKNCSLGIKQHLHQIILKVDYLTEKKETHNNSIQKEIIKLEIWLLCWKRNSVAIEHVLRFFIPRVRVMVFNATFNNISVILWRLVLLVEENGVPRESHRPATSSYWQTLSHNVVSSTPRLL